MNQATIPPSSAALALRLRRASFRLPQDGLTLRELADLHGPAAQGSLLMLLAAPCLLPIPGVGTVLGLSLLTLAAGLWRGASAHGLPERVAQLSLPTEAARRVLRMLAQCHGASAGLLKPRRAQSGVLASPRCLAAQVALMALLIVLPIPFGNILPALSLMLAGLALSARDGLAYLGSFALAAISTVVCVGVSVLSLVWGTDLLFWLKDGLWA